jgi:hypothetical protein
MGGDRDPRWPEWLAAGALAAVLAGLLGLIDQSLAIAAAAILGVAALYIHQHPSERPDRSSAPSSAPPPAPPRAPISRPPIRRAADVERPSIRAAPPVARATDLGPAPTAQPSTPLPDGFGPLAPRARLAYRCGICFMPAGAADIRHAVHGCGQPLHLRCLRQAHGVCPGRCQAQTAYS